MRNMRLSVTSKIAAATGAGIACVAIGVALAGSNHHASQTVVIRQDAATSSQTATASTSTAAPKTSASTTAAAAKQPAAVVQAPVQQAQPATPDSTIPAPPASSDVNTLPVATGTVGSDGVLRPPQPPLTISASTSPVNGG